MKKNCLLISVCSLVSALLILSCHVGLGEAVDIKAPTISITAPVAKAQVRDNFVISGLWNDDMGLNNIKIVLENTVTKQTYPEKSSQEEIAGIANEEPGYNAVFSSDGTWTCSIKVLSETGEKIIPDGSYIAKATATDNATTPHSTSATQVFSIDNTAPVLVITSPSSTDIENPATYGKLFSIQGTYSDDSNIDSILVTILDENGNEIDGAVKTLKIKGTTIDDTVALWEGADGLYEKIYGNNIDAGTKKFYTKVTIYDSARKVPAEQGDKGNSCGYFLMQNEVEEFFSNTNEQFKTTELYSLLAGTATAGEFDPAYTNLVESINDTFENESGVKKTRAAFSLNPVNNPTFGVSGYSSFIPGVDGKETELDSYASDGVSGLYEFKDKSSLSITVTPGRDGYLLRQNSLELSLIECSVDGNVLTNEDGTYKNQIKINKYDITVSMVGTSYSMEVQLRETEYDGLKIGNYYIIKVDGTDTKNNIISNGAQVFAIKYSPANTTPPLIKLTEPSSTALSIKNNAEVIFRGTVEYYQDELKMAAYIGDPSEDGYVVVPADKITIGNNISGGTKIKREFSFELPQSVLEDIEDGSFAVYVYAELVAAQQTGTAYVQITNDRNAPAFAEDYTITPTVEIADSEGKTVSYVNGTISIEASVSDDITLKPEVFYSLDDGANWNSLGAVTKISIKDIDTTKFADNLPKILTLKAVDGVGNESVKKITLNVKQSTDTPSVTVSNADVSFKKVNSIIKTQENIFGTTSNTNLSGYITDDDGIKTIKVLWQKGSEWLENAETEQKEYDVKGKTSYSLTHRLPEQEGSYVLKIQVQDEKQEKTGFNSCVVEPFVVGVDDGAPKVNVNVENGIYLAADSTYELAGTVDDEKAVVSIYSDSACTQNIGTATVKGKAWKYNLETGSKDRSIYDQAKDGFGLKSMAEFSYKVDTAAPVFAITSVNNESGTALSKDSELISLYGSLDNYFTVKGTLADEEGGSGLEGKMYYKVCSEQDKTEDGFYNLSDGKWLNIAIKNTANGYTWELPVDFASTKYESANTFGSFNNGDSVYIYFATKDNAGNVSLIKENPSAKIKVVIDGIAPEFKEKPEIVAGMTTTISVQAKDDETNVNKAELYLNGNKIEINKEDESGSETSGAILEVTDGTDDNLGYKNYTFKIAAEILAKGENKITVKAYDKAGNVSESKAAVIENNAPVFMEQNTGIPSAAYKKSYGNTAASIKEFSYVTGVFASVGKLQVSGKNNSLTSFTYKDTELVLENGAYVQKTLKSATEIDLEDDSFNVTFPAAGSSELEAYEGKVVTRTFTATNVYGLESTWEINFIFDTIKPVLDINKTSIGGKNVALLSQDSDVWFNAESLVTQGEYIENGSGLSKIEYTIVDSEGKALVSDGVIYPVGKTFRSMINGFAEGSGSNTLSIKAYDNAGNESELCVYDTICIDTTKPSAKQIAANKSNDITQSLSKSESNTPSDLSYVWYKYEGDTEWTKCESSPVVTNRERTIILCGGYSDEASVTDGIYSGVSEVKLSVNGYDSSCDLAPVFGRSDGVWTCTLVPDDLKDLFEKSDSYTATILLKDSVGNSDNSTTFTFKVDEKAPEFGDFSVTPSIEVTENGKTTYTVNGTVAIETSVSDNVTLRPAVDYSLDDGTTWISIDPATKITIPGIDTTKFNDNETKKIKLRAKDEVGNEEVTEIELNVDQSTDQPKLELSTADSEIKELGVLKERQLNIFGTLSNRNLIGSISDDDGISQVTVYWQSGETWVESANTESKTYTSNGKTTYNLNHVLPDTEGSYLIKIAIKDSKQETTDYNSLTVEPFIVGVDAGAPKLTVGSYDDIYLAKGHDFTLDGTVDDANATVKIYSDVSCKDENLVATADVNTVTGSASAKWAYKFTVGSAGQTLYVQAKDNFGQKSIASFTYKVDTQAPTFTITNVNGKEIALSNSSELIQEYGNLSSYFTVKGNLADEENGSGLSGSMYYKVSATEDTTAAGLYDIEDGSWQSVSIKQTENGATWEAPIPLTATKFVEASGNTAAHFDSFKDGDSVYIYFATKDNAGNVSLIAENPSAKINVVIDGVKPEFFKEAPDVDVQKNTIVTILTKDNETALESAKLYLNEEAIEVTPEESAGTGDNAGWTEYKFTVNSEKLVSGENKIKVQVTDKAGNLNNSDVVTIRNLAPEFKAKPAITVAKNPEISVIVKDRETNIASTKLYINGSSLDLTPEKSAGTGENEGWECFTYTIPSANLSDGDNKITIKAEDTSGSSTESQSIVIGNEALKFSDTETGIPAAAYRTDYGSESYYYVTKAFDMSGSLILNGENNKIDSLTYKDEYVTVNGNTESYTELKAEAEVELDETHKFTLSYPAADASEIINDYEGKFVTRTYTAKNLYGRETTWKVHFIFDTQKPVLNTEKDSSNKPYSLLGGINVTDLIAESDNWFDSESIEIKGRYNENGSGIKSINYSIVASDSSTKTGNLYTTDKGDYEEFTSIISGFVSGKDANIITIWATDNAGNKSSELQLFVNVDTTSPNLKALFCQKDEEAVTEANGTVYVNGSSNKLTVYGTYFDNESSLNALTFKLENAAFEGATVKYSETLIESEADLASAEWKNYDSVNKKAIKSWKAVFTPGETDEGEFIAHGKNIAKLTEHTDSNFIIKVDNKAPKLKGTITLKQVKDSKSDDVYQNKTSGKYYLNNENYTVTISGSSEDEGISGVDTVTLSVYDKDDNEVSNVIENPVVTTKDDWSFSGIDLSGIEGSATIKVTLKDKAGNTKPEELVQIIFDTKAPEAQHEFDSKNKDVYFRIGSADNEFYTRTEGTGEEAHTVKYMETGDVWDDELDADVGGKYSVGTYGNDSTIEIRGTFTENEGGSGINYIYYKIFAEVPTIAQIAALENGTLAADGKFAPQDTPIVRRVPKNTSSGKVSKEVSNNFRQSIKGFNNTSNYLVLVAEDYAGNRKADAPTTEVPYYSINKDTTAPKITSDSSLIFTNANTNLTVSGTASDSESGIRNVTVKIDETIGGTKIEFNQVVKPGADGKWSVEIPGSTFAGITSGSLSVYAIASDNAGSGNQKQISAASVTIDNQGPEVSLVSPGEDEITGTITLKGTANDEYSNVTAIGFAIVDNRYYEKNAQNEWVLSAAAKADADEDGSIKKAAKDAAESLYNNGSPKTWQFVLDGTESSEGKKNPVLPTAEGTVAGGVANTTSGIDCAPIPTGDEYTSDSDVRKLTLVFYAKDSLGNESWTPIEGENAIFITYNPFGDRPKASVGYPTGTFATALEDLSNLSGSIRVTGSAEDNVSMTGGAVYIQIDADKDGDFDETDKSLLAAMEKSDESSIYEIVDDITAVAGVSDYSALNGAQTWGIKATGTNSWNFTMNSSNELQNSSTKVSDGVYKVGFRAVAMDGTGVLGKWSSSAYYVIDVNAPSFKNAEIYSLDSEGNAIAGQVPVSYEQDMYLSGDKSLVLTIQDEVGLKNVKYTYDTSLDTINSATRNGEITKTTLDTAKTGTGPYTYKVSIPLSELGDADHLNSTTVALKVVATKDSDTETTSYERYLVHFDNTAPKIDNLTLNSVAYEDSDKKIVNSNGYFTIGGQASDEGAGFERMSFYFMRESGTTITESRIYDVMIAPDANETDSKKQPNYISTSGLATKTVTIGTGENAESFTIYGKSQELTVSAEKSGQTKLTGYKTDAHVRAGGYVQIGSTWHKIKKIDGENIILVTPTTALGKQTVFFAYMQSIDNTGTEKSDGLGGVSSGDDDDKMPESIIKSQTTWNYDASFFSNYIPDGPGKLVTFVYDKAGNVSAKTYNVSVQNKAPRLTKLWLSTDLNASGTFADDAESGLTEIIEYNVLGKVGEQTNYKNMKTADYKGERFIIKNKFAVIPEFTNGNGDIYMALNNAAETNQKPTELDAETYTTQTAAVEALYSSVVGETPAESVVPGIEGFTLAREGDSKWAYQIVNTSLGNGSYNSTTKVFEDRAMSFTFWDSTEDTISGVNSNWCYLRISDLVVNVDDVVPPNTVVEPFFWNSAEDNSLYQNSYENGHIELESSTGGDPAVSGKISIRGWAFDDHTLGSIWVKFDGFTPAAGTFNGTADAAGYYKVAAYVNKADGTGKEWVSYANPDSVGGNKWKFTVTPDYLGQAGHKAKWQLDIDTSAIDGGMGANKNVHVRAIDEIGSATDAAAATVSAHTSSQDPSDEEKGTADDVYNKPTYQMDVVPYISGICDANGNPANRSRLGRYPVRAGDTIQIKGFNFGEGEISVTRHKTDATTGGRGAVATTDGVLSNVNRVDANTISVKAPNYSGFIQLIITPEEGDAMTAVNNTNDNTLGYNIEHGYIATEETTLGRTAANTAGSNFWTDDRYLSVWNVGTNLSDSYYPISGTIDKYTGANGKKFKGGSNWYGDNGSVVPANKIVGVWAANDKMMHDALLGEQRYNNICHTSNNVFASSPDATDMCLINDVPFYVILDNGLTGSGDWKGGLLLMRDGQTYQQYIQSSAGVVEKQGNGNVEKPDSSDGMDEMQFQFKNPKIAGYHGTGYYYVYISYYDAHARCLKYAEYRFADTEKPDENYGDFTALAKANAAPKAGKTVVAGWDTLQNHPTYTEEAGEWSDIKIRGDKPVIVFYNKTTGKLEVATGKKTTPVTGRVDGEDSTAAGDGWFRNVLSRPDGCADFGRYVSMEIDASGNIYIASQDVKRGRLYYGKIMSADYGTTDDEIEVDWTLVDATDSVGRWTDIKLDSSNNPVITYMNSAKLNTTDAVKVAYLDGTSWECMTDPAKYESTDQKLSLVLETKDNSNKDAKVAIGMNAEMLALDFLRDE